MKKKSVGICESVERDRAAQFVKKGRIHFCGVGGTGLSALARLAVRRGRRVSGSDRSFDRGEMSAELSALAAEGIVIVPQDGSAAVEAEIPDLVEARNMGVPIVSRAGFLRELGKGKRLLAVAGTNGKSSTTAMLGWILHRAGLDPSVILGAAVLGDWGGTANARSGGGEIFLFEADESDGELSFYRPETGVITNISADHYPLPETEKVFSDFAASVTGRLLVGSDSEPVRRLGASGAERLSFGFAPGAGLLGSDLALSGTGTSFQAGGVEFKVPQPGRYNALNALGAAAAAAALGVGLKVSALALADFPGIARRMEVVASRGSVIVLDDYAHNPDKIASALAAARLFAPRLIVIYRPHGFAPLRKSLTAYAAAFRSGLAGGDLLLLLPVYDAGGTAPRDVSSVDLARAVGGGVEVRSAASWEEASGLAAAAVAPGTAVIFMGARDPGLSPAARAFGAELETGGE